MAAPVQECGHPIVWLNQYTARTTTNGYPSGSAVGVALSSISSNNRRAIGKDLFVRIVGTLNSTTLSSTHSLYGMHEDGTWSHLADVNDGAAITVALQPKSSPGGSTDMTWLERFEGLGGAFTRYYVRVDTISGTSYSLAVDIGFQVA